MKLLQLAEGTARWRRALPPLMILILGGCATSRVAPPRPPAEPRPLASAAAIGAVFRPGAPARGDLATTASATTLTLAQALRIAADRNPNFKEFAISREAARAEVLRAIEWPNPELEASAGVAIGRESPKETRATYGLGLTQLLEWPAKRRARRAAAEAAAPVVDREEEAFRATLRADVMKAYAAALYYRRSLDLAREALETTRQIEGIVARRVEGGEAPEIDRVQARVERLEAARAVQAQQRLLEGAKAALNALCGRGLPVRFEPAGELSGELAGADLRQAREVALAQHPTLRRLAAVARQKELAVEREKKAWWPDLRPGLGWGREFDADTFGASLGMELPLWNRNKAGIAAAQAELKKAQAELERARQEVERDVETAWQAYESAREQVAAFGGGLSAAAAESLRIASFLYEQGETDFLKLLDARRTARQTASGRLQALYELNTARAELERAIGIGGVKE